MSLVIRSKGQLLPFLIELNLGMVPGFHINLFGGLKQNDAFLLIDILFLRQPRIKSPNLQSSSLRLLVTLLEG
jgi:hypothetical protein